MSTISIAQLRRVSAKELSTFLLSPDAASSIAVVDVRDADHVGGHIRNSMHIPSSSLDYRIPELVRTLQHTKVVVFHCMLSQQRGPSAALRYARERIRLLGSEGAVAIEDPDEQREEESDMKSGQKVCVLDGGFDSWRQHFGEDERLTENYDKELWDEGLD